MKKKLTLTMVMLLCMSVTQLMAQSVSYAKSLIEQGRYLDAAKQLRPLADNGDAEAQYLAATLFFEGKGVNYNDAQGIKYATLSANQGNTQAILLLADHYRNGNQYQKYYDTLEYYIKQHPYLKKEFIGLRYAECYMLGWGVEKDEEKAWQLASQNKNFSKMKTSFPNQWAAYKNRHPELYATLVYDNIRVRNCPRASKILKVTFEAERTVVTLRYTNITKMRRWIASDSQNTYIQAGGKRYRMTGSTLPDLRKQGNLYVQAGQSYEYNHFFEPVARNINSFDLIEDVNGGDRFIGVTFR